MSNDTNKSELFTNQYLEVTEKNLFLHYILYNIFYRFPVILMIYITLFYPTLFYYHISCFIITYIQEQIIFMIGHISVHVHFNYAKPTINDMGLFSFGIGYIHHYYNYLIHSKMNFYSYCNQYIENLHLKSSLINQYKSFTKNILFIFFIPLYFIMPNNYNILYLSLLFYYLDLARLSYLLFIGYFMKIYNVNNIYICIYILYQIFHIYLQAITHLWYHTLESNKKQHFGLFLYYLMSFLEKIKIISSKTHKIHHKHRLNNLTEVEIWYDLYIPSFINSYADNLFKYIIQLDSENDIKIKKYNSIKTKLYFTAIISFTCISIINYKLTLFL